MRPINQETIKKGIMIGWAVLTLVLVGAVVYQFGFRQLLEKSYEKGVLTGKQEINATILNNLFQFGRIQVNIPVNEKGEPDLRGNKLKAIILAPLQRNGQDTQNGATTTPE